MKKEGVIAVAVLFLILSLSLVSVIAVNDSASTTTTAGVTPVTDDTAVVTKAYNCLKSKVTSADNCKSLSAEEQALSLLALAYDETSQRSCLSALNDFSNNDLCWPSTGCQLKETALAILAKKYINQDTEDSEQWLLEKNMTPSNLIWYLQVDADGAASCQVNIDDGTERDFSIDEDKKLSGDASGCLIRAQDDYWFRISSSCYDKKFTVSCDQAFVTNLLYQKENSQTIFVSSRTSQSSAGGQTFEKVNVMCFGTGSSCDYEGSLWATIALSQTGNDVSAFIPYLSAASSDNEKYSPYPFLFYLTAEDIYLSNTLRARLTAKYWQAISTPYGKYYDSALAIMFLTGSGAQEIDESKAYFLSIADNNGCWPSIKDSALLLFASWPRAAASIGTQNPCSPTYYCISSGDCAAAFGTPLPSSEYSCPNALSVCCNKPAVQKTCVEKGGNICTGNEGCAGGSFATSTDSTNSKCCIGGTCAEIIPDDCAGNCKSSCESGESLLEGTCSGGNVCCSEKSSSLWWLWLLIILIILGILGFIFRDKLRILWFKISSKFSKSPPPSPQGMRGMPPRYPMPPNQQQFRMPQPPRGFQPQGIRSSEFDNTLRKLKDMSR